MAAFKTLPTELPRNGEVGQPVQGPNKLSTAESASPINRQHWPLESQHAGHPRSFIALVAEWLKHELRFRLTGESSQHDNGSIPSLAER
jgi:hypothetical protein